MVNGNNLWWNLHSAPWKIRKKRRNFIFNLAGLRCILYMVEPYSIVHSAQITSTIAQRYCTVNGNILWSIISFIVFELHFLFTHTQKKSNKNQNQSKKNKNTFCCSFWLSFSFFLSHVAIDAAVFIQYPNPTTTSHKKMNKILDILFYLSKEISTMKSFNSMRNTKESWNISRQTMNWDTMSQIKREWKGKARERNGKKREMFHVWEMEQKRREKGTKDLMCM